MCAPLAVRNGFETTEGRVSSPRESTARLESRFLLHLPLPRCFVADLPGPPLRRLRRRQAADRCSLGGRAPPATMVFLQQEVTRAALRVLSRAATACRSFKKGGMVEAVTFNFGGAAVSSQLLATKKRQVKTQEYHFPLRPCCPSSGSSVQTCTASSTTTTTQLRQAMLLTADATKY